MGLGSVCACVSVCAPVCSHCWSFDPGSPWRQWLRQHHAGDKIDVDSPPKHLQNINRVGDGVGGQPNCVFLTEICWYHTLQLHASVRLPSDKWRSRGTLMVSVKNPREKITLWNSDEAVYLHLQCMSDGKWKRKHNWEAALCTSPAWCSRCPFALLWVSSVVYFAGADPPCHPILVSLLPNVSTLVLNRYTRVIITLQAVCHALDYCDTDLRGEGLWGCEAAGWETCVSQWMTQLGSNIFRFGWTLESLWK